MVRKFDIAVPGDRVFTEIHGEGWRQAVIAVIVAVKAVDACWYDAEDIYVKNTRYIIICTDLITVILRCSEMAGFDIIFPVPVKILCPCYCRHVGEWK
jgi:hypothetical protein